MKYALVFCLLISFVSLGQIHNNFRPFKDADGWGVKRITGEELFSERFDSISPSLFIGINQIKFEQDGKWGVVDTTGKIVLPARYGNILSDPFGYRIFTGEAIISPQGFINKEGDTLVEPKYLDVWSETVVPEKEFVLIVTPFGSDDLIYGMYSSEGKQVLDCIYSEIAPIDSSQHIFHQDVEGTHHFALLDAKGEKAGVYSTVYDKIVVPVIYDDVCYTWCSEGGFSNIHKQEGDIVYTGERPFFKVKKDGKYVFLKDDGTLIFDSGMSTRSGKFYLNSIGELSPYVGKCVEFDFNAKPPFIMKENGMYFLVDQYGVPIPIFKKSKYSMKKIEIDGEVYISFMNPDSERCQLADSKGNVKLMGDWLSIEYSSEFELLFAVTKDGLYEYFSHDFKEVPKPIEKKKKFRYSYIEWDKSGNFEIRDRYGKSLKSG